MTTALANTDRMNTLRGLFDRARPSIASVLPKHLKAEKICKIALVAASRNPLLLQCSADSILKSVMSSSQLGLEPDGPLGHAYLIPYKNNKTGHYEAQFQVGYKGLIELARRSGRIKSIESHVVYEADKFECEFGLERKLVHVPNFEDKEPGKIRLAYAVAHMSDGGIQFEVMTRAEIDRIRSSSKAGRFGPWEDHFPEMCRKTVVKRLCKMLPMSIELSQAVNHDNAVESEEEIYEVNAIDLPAIEETPAEEPASKADTMAAKIGG